MLDAIEIAGRVVTADALLTQRDLATYLVQRGAHYHFTVKGNQPTLQDDIRLLFAQRAAADHTEVSPADHGRIETRRIWCSHQLNDYLQFPHVGQVFLIEREEEPQVEVEAIPAAPPAEPEPDWPRDEKPLARSVRVLDDAREAARPWTTILLLGTDEVSGDVM